MNESFKSVFYEEEEFIESNNQATQEGLRDSVVEKQKIRELLEKVDIRKAMGPDGVTFCVLINNEPSSRSINSKVAVPEGVAWLYFLDHTSQHAGSILVFMDSSKSVAGHRTGDHVLHYL
ncbi:hypothetical protein E2C01_034051 [Portunus trituberculatus]|uniref:Uncharacterized protein n=1 Tax=Portunus trituberculatus TaxID=210409 RepID=A0A5B7F0F8_PORTR|nr:hypothetical protein [Portunus trituberculatus]